MSSLLSFFSEVRSLNPFLDNRVNGPVPAETDVVSIHSKAFEQLTQLAGQALRLQRGLGAVLWGEAGVGKSHLLARLARWANEQRALFLCAYNLQAAPDALPRSLLHTVVHQLVAGRRDRFRATPLYQLLRETLIATSGKTVVSGWTELGRSYNRWLDTLGGAVGDRRAYQALFAFFRAANEARPESAATAEVAVRWLSGGVLDAEEARLLGFKSRRKDGPVGLEDPEEIKQVLVALARLALMTQRPFILALDQVDNLDEEQFASLARFLEAMLDAVPNLLAITTGVSASLLRWREKGIVQASAWDRIGQSEIRLLQLRPAEAEELIRVRLAAFLHPFADIPELQACWTTEPLFPLGRDWAAEHLHSRTELRARDAISLAREGWQQAQLDLGRLGDRDWLEHRSGRGETPIVAVWEPGRRNEEVDRKIRDELQEIIRNLHEQPGALSRDPGHLAGVLFDLLKKCEGASHGFKVSDVIRLPPPRKGAHPTYHISFRQNDRTTGVLILTEEAKVAVAGFLRRLLEESRPLDRVVVVTDEHGARLGPKGEEYWRQLVGRGRDRFYEVQLAFVARARLEALSRVLGRARSGDLDLALPGGSLCQLDVDEVVESLHRRGELIGHPLLAELLRGVPRTGVAG